MKKITFKAFVFLLTAMFTFQVQGQIVDGGKYRLKNVATGKYLQATSTAYQPSDFIANDMSLEFLFVLVNIGGVDFYNIDSEATGRGVIRGTGGAFPTPFALVNTAIASPTTATDKIWKAIYNSTTMTYRFEQNNSLRYIYHDSDDMYYNEGTVEGVLDTDTRTFWTLENASLSSEGFDTSSVFISNPVKNSLDIKGLSASVNKVSVYSLLGKSVLTKNLDGKSDVSIDISNLTAGMYIVKLQGDNISFSKKIIKQ